MSKTLLDALESRVNSAVQTIDGLRTEVRDLRDERRALEEKLRELLGRIEAAENGAAASEMPRPAHSHQAGQSSSDF